MKKSLKIGHIVASPGVFCDVHIVVDHGEAFLILTGDMKKSFRIIEVPDIIWEMMKELYTHGTNKRPS